MIDRVLRVKFNSDPKVTEGFGETSDVRDGDRGETLTQFLQTCIPCLVTICSIVYV